MHGCHQKIMKLFRLTFIFLTLIAAPAMSNEKKEQSDLAVYKEISQSRLDNARDLLQKDIQALSVRLDVQDKRLDTQNAHIDQSLSILGTLLSYLGIVLALAGLAGYVSVQSKAKKEAQREAKATTNEWFERSSADVQIRLNALQSKLDTLENQAESNFSSHMQLLIDKQALADLAMKNIQQSIIEARSLYQAIPEGEAQALAEAAQATKNKPEVHFTFTDWNYRAFDALSKGDKENAIQYWLAAAKSNSISPIAKSQALFNAGTTLANLNRHDEAVAIFDEILQTFDERSMPDLERNVAQALNGKIVSLGIQARYDEALANADLFLERFINSQQPDVQTEIRTALLHKSVTFQKMERHDDCLVTYDEILKRFEQSEDENAKAWCLTALTSKGITLNKMGRNEEGIAILDSIIAKHAEDETETIRKEVGKAMNSKGYWLLCKAKENWADTVRRIRFLEQAHTILMQAIIYYPKNAFILGNLAYNSHLRSDSTIDVTNFLKEALSIGKKNLYEETINDLNVFPLGPRDDAFRDLLNYTWSVIDK